MSHDTRDRLRAAYDRVAGARDRREPIAWKQAIRTSFLQRLQEESHRSVLEIGSGPGHDGTFFANEGLNIVCVDLSPNMVRLCQEKGLEAHVMDAVALRFQDDSFDAAYSFNAYLHLPRTELPAALREVKRVLRTGGLFFLGLYGGFDHEGIWEEDECRPKRFFSFRTDDQLLAAVHDPFDVISFERTPIDSDDPHFHFQSLILRKRSRSP